MRSLNEYSLQRQRECFSAGAQNALHAYEKFAQIAMCDTFLLMPLVSCLSLLKIHAHYQCVSSNESLTSLNF